MSVRDGNQTHVAWKRRRTPFPVLVDKDWNKWIVGRGEWTITTSLRDWVRKYKGLLRVGHPPPQHTETFYLSVPVPLTPWPFPTQVLPLGPTEPKPLPSEKNNNKLLQLNILSQQTHFLTGQCSWSRVDPHLPLTLSLPLPWLLLHSLYEDNSQHQVTVLHVTRVSRYEGGPPKTMELTFWRAGPL